MEQTVKLSNEAYWSSAVLPNPLLVTRQIEGLREVMRRLKNATQTLDQTVGQKVEKLTKN